ncbi:hypothetical protein [Georgenia sp. SUBG003]|uniref:hypothetical protein n=1 Tax=Georgenia sp. SUBG003 TaxID=1497974 RepID=UPI0004D849DD|nr:hypothetical protein DA06_03465 [Georgenia sp. SUBG003]
MGGAAGLGDLDDGAHHRRREREPVDPLDGDQEVEGAAGTGVGDEAVQLVLDPSPHHGCAVAGHRRGEVLDRPPDLGVAVLAVDLEPDPARRHGHRVETAHRVPPPTSASSI